MRDLEQLRHELRGAAADGGVSHADRMAGVERRVRRARTVRLVVPIALVLVALLAFSVVRVLGDRAPVVPAGYDGSYPGPETFDRLAVDGTCPRGGQPGSGTEVPVGPPEVTAGAASALGGPLVEAVRAAGAPLDVARVERTATSLTPGAPPCGPSYAVYLSGDDGAAQLLVTLSWAGDDRFAGSLRCPQGAAAQACTERAEDGWAGTLQQAPGGTLLVLARGDGPTAPVVAVRQLRGEVLDPDALAGLAVARDWHRLAEQVESEVAP